MSAMIGTTRSLGNWRRSSRSISKIWFSLWSTAISSLGSSEAICRHSSLPIEPPAPVTSTAWPVASSWTAARSVTTSSRRRRSWISTCRSGFALMRPARVVVDAVDRARLNSGVAGRLHDAADGAAARLWHRDDDFVDAQAADERGEVGERTEDGNPAEQLLLLGWIVVGEGDDVEFEAFVEAGLAGDGLSRGAGADDDRAAIPGRTVARRPANRVRRRERRARRWRAARRGRWRRMAGESLRGRSRSIRPRRGGS